MIYVDLKFDPVKNLSDLIVALELSQRQKRLLANYLKAQIDKQRQNRFVDNFLNEIMPASES